MTLYPKRHARKKAALNSKTFIFSSPKKNSSKPQPFILRELVLREAAIQFIKILIKPPRHLNDIAQMLIRQRFPLPLSILPRSSNGIPNLPPIHLLLLEILQMIAQVRNIHLVVIPKRLEPVQEILPDPEALVWTQDRVMQRELDAGFEGFVKGADAVAREHEDAFVVFEHAQEHRDEGVPLHVFEAALFEEDVGFVEEHDAAPDLAEMQDRFEVFFHVLGFGADVPTCHAVQGLLCNFGNAFCCQCLACAGASMQQQNEAVAFAHDQVRAFLSRQLIADKGSNKVAGFTIDDEVWNASLFHFTSEMRSAIRSNHFLRRRL